MGEKIGYQDGITAFFNWYRKQPGVPQRGPNYDPADMATWPWPDKMERTLRILKDDHDAVIPVPPTPPPPVAYKRVAPRVANKEGTSDARFCCVNQPGVVKQPDGTYADEAPARYDANGLSLGGRDPDLQVPGLPGAKQMDGRMPCEISPVGDPTMNTGSWAI